MTFIKRKYYNLIPIFILLMSGFVIAQSPPARGELQKEVQKSVQQQPKTVSKPAKAPTSASSRQMHQTVELLHSDLFIVDEENLPDVQLLRGNVNFKHDNAIMYCDSAFFYQKENSFDAYSNVRIIQADTLFIYGDYLYYDGNTRLAQLRENVRLVNKRAILTTDSLNYDRNTNLAYYFTGGQIKDNRNTLTSVWGQYNTDNEIAIFQKNVRLVNPDFVMNSDTLVYNTLTHIADIVGKTHIIYKKETDIYSTKGWYNTESEQSVLLDRSKVVNKSGKTLIGDTIFYDKQKNRGEAFSEVELTDTAQGTTLSGDYVFYNDSTEYGFATDSALLIYWKEKENAYIHADTLETKTEKFVFKDFILNKRDSVVFIDSIAKQDTIIVTDTIKIEKDSAYNLAFAYHGARMYRSDIQGIADSLIYSSQDSIMNLYGLPVVWAQGSQISGDEIHIFTKNQQAEKVQIIRDAIMSQKTDSTLYFNQIAGKEIIANLNSEGQLHHVFVNGNAETIYLPVDDTDSTMIGINKSQSSYVNMYFKEKKIDKVVLTTVSQGSMFPLGQLGGGELYLKNFFWAENQQPVSPIDVFRTPDNTEREMLGAKSKGLAAPAAPSQQNAATQNQNSERTQQPLNSSTQRSNTQPTINQGINGKLPDSRLKTMD
ncbi:MAG: hypothetical protein LBB41_04490 [Prevotellaceae bacterium]|jgi:lipopolysaccharide export system protein LptA|nr:hypothetical protein [Prevotellaceae bacterium]